MSFEWKQINEASGNRITSQSGERIVKPEQKPIEPQAHTSAGTAPETIPEVASETISEAVPVEDVTLCSADKAAEKGGYNSVYDSDVCSAYDAGANADENSVVA